MPTLIMAVKNTPNSEPCRKASGPSGTLFREPRRTKLAPLSSSTATSSSTSTSSSAATKRSSSISSKSTNCKTELTKLAKPKPRLPGPISIGGPSRRSLPASTKAVPTTNQPTRRNTTTTIVVGGGGNLESITIPPKSKKSVKSSTKIVPTLRLTTSEPPKLKRNTLDPALKQDLYLMLQSSLNSQQQQLWPAKSDSTISPQKSPKIIQVHHKPIPELVLLKPESLKEIIKPLTTEIKATETSDSELISKPIAIAEPSPLEPELLREMFVRPEPEITNQDCTEPESPLYVTVETSNNKPPMKPLEEEENLGDIIGKFLESTNNNNKPKVLMPNEESETNILQNKESCSAKSSDPLPPSTSSSSDSAATTIASSQQQQQQQQQSHHNFYHYHQYHYYCCSNRKCLRKMAKSSSQSKSSRSHIMPDDPELEAINSDEKFRSQESTSQPASTHHHYLYRRHRRSGHHHRKSSILSLGSTHSVIEFPLSFETETASMATKVAKSLTSTADSSFSSSGPSYCRRPRRINSASMQVLLANSSFEAANATRSATSPNDIRLPQLAKERKKQTRHRHKHNRGRHRQNRSKPEVSSAISTSTTAARSSISYLQNKFKVIRRRLSDVALNVSGRRRSVQTDPLQSKSKSKITTRSLPSIYPLKTTNPTSSSIESQTSAKLLAKSNAECRSSTKSLADSNSQSKYSKSNSKIRFSVDVESVAFAGSNLDQFSLGRSSSTSSLHSPSKQMPSASTKTSLQSKSSVSIDENGFESLLRHNSFLRQIDPLPSRLSAAVHPNKFTSSTFSLLTSGQASTSAAAANGIPNAASLNRLIQEIKDHKNGVNCLELSEDRSLLVSGGEDSVVRLWSTFSTPCECIGILTGHRSYITCCAIYRHFVISGSADKTLKIWTIQEGNCVRTLRGHGAFVNRCYCYGPLLMSTSFDCTVRVWSLTDQLTIVRYINSSTHDDDEYSSDDDISDDLKTELESGQNVELSNSNGSTSNGNSKQRSQQRRKSFSNSDIITRQNVNTSFGSCLHILKGHTKSITQVAVVSNDENEIQNRIIQELNTIAVTVSTDGTGRTWNLATGEIRHVLLGHNGPINCLAIDPKERQYLYTAGSDSVIKCWDIITGEHLRDLKGHQDAVLSLVAHNRILYSGSSDNTARAWAMEFGQCTRIFYKSTAPITAIQIYNGILYTGSNDNSTRLYDSNSAVLLQTFTAHTNSISALRIVPGKLFTASFDGRILVWDCADLQSEIEPGETPASTNQLNSRASLSHGAKWLNNSRNRLNKLSMQISSNKSPLEAGARKDNLPVTGKLAMLHRQMLKESSKQSSSIDQHRNNESASLYRHQSTETDQDRTIQSLIKSTVPGNSQNITRNNRSKKSSSKPSGNKQLSKLWSVSKNLFAVRASDNPSNMADYSTGIFGDYERIAQDDSANVRRAINALEPYIRSFR